MTSTRIRAWAIRGGAACLLCGISLAVIAATAVQKVEPTGPAPAKIQALVGLWQKTRSDRGVVPPAGQIAFNPVYEARRREAERKFTAHEVLPGRNSKCIPDGLPDMMTFGFRLEANAAYMTMIGGNGPTIRIIWLNRKQHTESRLLFPTYGGEGIAHWEGDTLVVDTIGLTASNEITYGLPLDDEHIHIVERFLFMSADEIEVTTTIESPAALLKPWTYKSSFQRRPLNGDISYCDRPVVNDSLDLTPPKGGYVPPGADE